VAGRASRTRNPEVARLAGWRKGCAIVPKKNEAIVQVVDHGIYREILVDARAPKVAKQRAAASLLPLAESGWADLSKKLDPAQRVLLLKKRLQKILSDGSADSPRAAGIKEAAAVLALIDAIEKTRGLNMQDCDIFYSA
jgi:hypothetical protein